MSLVRKMALLFPPVRKVKEDLHNRRIRAEEFETANKALLARLEFMKTQMAKALGLKETADLAKSTLAADAKHYESQLSIMTDKYKKIKSEYEDLESENLLLKLANEDLIVKNAYLIEK